MASSAEDKKTAQARMTDTDPTAKGWRRVELPAIPTELRGKFEAHSVTAASNVLDMSVPAFCWNELPAGLLDGPTEMAVREAYSYRPSPGDSQLCAQIIIPLLADMLDKPASSGTRIVVFRNGTLIRVELDSPSVEFGGFVQKAGSSGFPYRIPVHRFQQGKGEGRVALQCYQEWYDSMIESRAEWKPAIDRALVLLTASDYPRPGTVDSNANVIKLWRKADELLGLVVCGAKYGGFGLLGTTAQLRFAAAADPPRDITLAMVKRVADTGRDGLRLDILMPLVVAVVNPLRPGDA